VTPQVSILLPAFDAESTLATCLRSIERQTETRFECLLVDDGSRDRTLGVARSFAGRDRRFVVVECQHRGLVATLNAGLDRCRAPFVARMDADDWMHRERLALQLAELERQPELAAVGCHVRLFPRRALTQGRRRYERWLNRIRDPEELCAEAFVECPVAHPTLFIRREQLRALGYRDRGWAEDYDLILRLLGRGHSIGVIPRRLVAWRDHPSRLSRRGEAYRLERFTACKAHFLARSFLAGGSEYILWGYGDTGRELRLALAKHDRHPRHIVELHPGRIGQRIHGAQVIPPEALTRVHRCPIVVSVAGQSARSQIRGALSEMGFRERADFVCAA
jgi:glycosyltransferase involved in cell wall biosynthesis